MNYICPLCNYRAEDKDVKCPKHPEDSLITKETKKKCEQYETDNCALDDRMDKALEPFNSPDLLSNIYCELEKHHVSDGPEKLFAFILTRTAYLPNHQDRKSICLRGDSSVGKDNLVTTILRLTPIRDYYRLTRATQSALEDNISEVKIIAFSEVNQNRENGANSNLVEVIKQMSEGGTASMKKDAATGFKEVKHIIQEQKTVIYSTTEDNFDPELDTRFTSISIRSSPHKTAEVNSNTLNQAAGIMPKDDYNESWILKGHSYLKSYEVIFPHLASLKTSENFFDNANPRSQRDLKKIIALAKAITWLHQTQRPIVELDGEQTLVGYPEDFLSAVLLGSRFFDSSYSGLEERTRKLLEKIKESSDWVDRAVLMSELGISLNTLKSRVKVLINQGFVEFEKDQSTKKIRYMYSSRGGKNHIKFLSEAVKIRDTFEYFDIKSWHETISKKKKLVPFDTNLISILTDKFSKLPKIEELWMSKFLEEYDNRSKPMRTAVFTTNPDTLSCETSETRLEVETIKMINGSAQQKLS